MTDSSRTPEGSPSRCPICGHEVRLELSADGGDAKCPHCGCVIGFEADSQGSLAERVGATKSRIRSWVRRLAQLSRSPADADQYYQEMVRVLVLALVARGGAVWSQHGRTAELRCSVGVSDGGIAKHLLHEPAHARLLERAFAAEKPFIVPPDPPGQVTDEAGNPTEFLLLFAHVKRNADPVALVEVFQRTGSSTVAQRGYLRFVQQICELAAGPASD